MLPFFCLFIYLLCLARSLSKTLSGFPFMILHCADRQLDLSVTRIMGVLNATPDSFSDGGRFNALDSAMQRAEDMLLQGAVIIDVGGESTRPGAQPVSLAEELDRVIPVVEKIATQLDVCISVDTSSPVVMREAKGAGAHLLNDVRALARDGAVSAAKETGLPICLMHMQGEPDTMQANPHYAQVVNEVYAFLSERIQVCEAAGIELGRILVDPGFGFGKSMEHNYQILSQLARFADLGVPVLAGLSRKTMIGAALANQEGVSKPIDERVVGSVAGAVIAAMNGAQIVRVHDVKETADALKVVEATLAQQN